MAIAGRVAIVPKGDWSADATYKRLDAVTYNNTLYFAKKEVPAGTATSNTEYWSKSIVGSVVTVDDALSSTSTNPVQNKVVKAYVDKKVSENVDFSTSTSKTLNDTVEAPLMIGKATRNLLNPTLQTTTTKNGVTCTSNGDGTYTLNGTATKTATFIVQNMVDFVKKHVNKDIRLVGCPKNGGVGNKYRLQFWGDSNGSVYDVGNGDNIHFKSIDEDANIAIIIDTGVTVNNLVFKPMLTTDLDATYDDFVPYSGYNIKTIGKNLLNLTFETTTSNGVTFTNNGDNSFTIKGTSTDSSYTNSILIPVEIGKKYNLVGKYIAAYLKNNITQIVTNHGDVTSTIFTATEDKVNICLYVTKKDGKIDNVVTKPMLTTDLDATYDDFVPYTESTAHIDSSTEFPLLGLKSFDGETNIISPSNVEVTYAKSDSGAAILDMSENKLDKDNVVNNQNTTVEGFALDARQANPNIDGTLAKQVADLNGSLNKSHMDCLWTGKASNMERVDFSNPISNYPSARMLIFVFHYDEINNECIFDFPIFNLKNRTNFLTNNTEIALTIVPPDQIFDTFCYLTWTSTKDYYLKSVYIEY